MKKSLIITFAIIGSIIGGVVGGVLYFNKVQEADYYKSQLEYVYQQNFYELVDNVNNIESNLSKLSIATTPKMQNDYLTKISTLASNAQDNISVLPIEHNSINDTITYLNKLGGYASTLQKSLVNNKSITLDQQDQIENLLDTSKTVKIELNKLSMMISSDNYSIVDNLTDPNKQNSRFNDEWANFNNGNIEYPQLIYDGPFSDSVVNKEIKGLSQNEITSAQALIKMQNWFKNYEIEYTGETKGGDFDTYNFELNYDQNQYYAQVSVRDGVLLALDSGQSSGAQNYSQEECCTFALKFAQSFGFENLKVVWDMQTDGFVYANLAPMQKDVILYPDEIKVKISAANGQIVGWEAKSWAYNHITRQNLTPTISSAQAKESLSPNLDVRTTKLVVAPNEFVGETLCWEFMCIYDASTYYVYIDAKTGEQSQILKVVETTDGSLLM
ncbi:MAG: germination protein YpeB [Clostridia bacterium]|nr:germination protein YpeB [Clostridia bacterium]